MSKFQASPRTLKLLDTLTPHARGVILEALNTAYELGLNMQVHSAYRSPQEQDKIFAQGRTLPGKIVTNARGTPVAQSAHCYKVAVDCHFDNNQDGVAEWESSNYEKVWAACKAKGLDKKGLWWSGLWQGSLKESAHWEVTFGKNWRDLAAGFDPSKHSQAPTTPAASGTTAKAPATAKPAAPKTQAKTEKKTNA